MSDVIVIGVAGGTGSGKTTLVKALMNRFGDNITVLSHDNYYKRHDELSYEERTRLNYDHPDAFDTDMLVDALRELRAGHEVQCPVYDYSIHDRTDKTITVRPARVIIVEGILIFQSLELCEQMDIKIYVDTDADVRILRRIVREIPVILAMGLIAAMLTLTAAQCLYQPEYTASATVAVNAKNASYASVFSNLTTTSEIANTFTTLFGSDVFKTLSADEQSEQQMSGRLTASVVPETNLLQLKVTASEPVAAFRTLRFVLDHYDVISQHIFQNIVLRELDPPVVPAEPSNPLQLRSLAKRAFLLGMLGMVALLLAIIVRCLIVAREAPSRMESLVCVGMAGMLIFQTIANIGMCLFLLPVIGLTLPFFSYGGSSIVTLFAAMGVVSGIKKRSRPEWLIN